MPAEDRRGAFARVVRFGIAGVLNTLFSYAVFAASVLLGAGPLTALITTTIASLAFNFQMSRRMVFRNGARGRLPRFLLVYAVIIALNWASLHGLAAIGVSALLGQAILVLPVALLSFVGQQSFVFAQSAQERCP